MTDNKQAGNNEAVHHGEVAALLPPSPMTGRPYTGTSVRRWIEAGVLRSCRPEGRRGLHVVRADVKRLAKHLRTRKLPRPGADQ